MRDDIRCPPCGYPAELVTGETIYPHRPDLYARWFWLCRRCGRYVGCHRGTKRALGTPADLETRIARHAAHEAFDRLWQGGKMGRKDAYAALATHLKIPVLRCHIGSFEVGECREVVRFAERARRGNLGAEAMAPEASA